MHRTTSMPRVPPPASPSPLYRQRGFEVSSVGHQLEGGASTSPTSRSTTTTNSYVNPLMIHNVGSSAGGNQLPGTYDFRATSHAAFDEALRDLVDSDTAANNDGHYHLTNEPTSTSTQSPTMAIPHSIPSVPRYFSPNATGPGSNNARFRASPYSQSGPSSGVLSPNSGSGSVSGGYGTDNFFGLEGDYGSFSTVDDAFSNPSSFPGHDPATSSPLTGGDRTSISGKALSTKSRHNRRYSASGGGGVMNPHDVMRSGSDIAVKPEPLPMAIPPSPDPRSEAFESGMTTQHSLPYTIPTYAHQRTPTLGGTHPASVPWMSNDPNLADSSSLFGSAPGASPFYPTHVGYGPSESPAYPHRGFIPSSAPATSTAFTGMTAHRAKLANVGEDGEQHELIEKMEKRKEKRRVSHNLVERRRRDNINNQIHELAMLLPSIYLEAAITPPPGLSSSVRSNEGEASFVSPSGTPLSPGLASPPANFSYPGKGGSLSAGPMAKPNKGIVLAKSVDYIRHLLEIVQAQNARNRQLASMVTQLGGHLDAVGIDDDDALLQAVTTGSHPESLGGVPSDFLAAFAQHMGPGGPAVKRPSTTSLSRRSSNEDDGEGDEADGEGDDDVMQI